MEQKSVLITGAAAGIGRAAALRFAREGYLVGAFDIDEVGLAALADEAPELVTGPLDVRSETDWQRALQTLTERTGGTLGVLVNNAGVLHGGRFAEIPSVQHRLAVDVNVTGVLLGCHAAYPYLRRSGGAHVVNLASASAIYGQAELATYSATKFAVRGLTEALDLEWAADDITVTALWPLFVSTAMTDGLDIGTTRSLGIHLTAEEVAEEILVAATAGHGILGGAHRAVGLQARALFAASSLSPSWLTRLVNKRLAGSHAS